MLNKIVQFEVYVQEKGRWSFHARYPGYEWDQALEDARRTEVRTGFPAKIIRDTYDRDKGASEETVAYQSPNTKKNGTRQRSGTTGPSLNAPPPKGGKSTPRATGKGRSDGQPVAPVSDTTFFTRLILSLGASVVIAGALTILLNAVLNALPKIGFVISSAAASKALIYWYVAMMMLSAIALNKAYVPWRRMLAGRNAQAIQLETEPSKTVKNRKSKPTEGFEGLKPKNQNSEQKAEREKAILEVKALRGDLDSIPAMEPPELPEPSEQMPLFPSLPSDQTAIETPQGLPANMTSGSSQAGGFDSSLPPEHANNPHAPGPHSIADGEQDNVASNAPNPDAEADGGKQTPMTDMDMDQLVMVRFIGDVVMSVRSGQDQLDGTTRFGMNLYLAGAASTLADQHGLTPRREKEILSDGLEMIGHSAEIREDFLARYDEHLNAKRNQSLIQAGEQDMLEHIRSTGRPAQQLGGLLEKWNEPAPAPQPAVKAAFLLTYIDIPPSTRTEAANTAMERHNQEVRQVLADCDGSEVRHTGKGIFAHFDHPDDAICAAISIQKSYEQQRKSTAPLPPARVALVAALQSGRDSDISGEIFRAADSLCRRMTDAQIATDALLSNACDIPDVTFGRDIPHAHSGIADGPKAVEVLWQPLAATL